MRNWPLLLAWLAVIGIGWIGVDLWLQPRGATVTAAGELRIPRHRDGHFWVEGTVNGRPVRFLVDTGASSVVVSEDFAQRAGLQGGQPTVFSTANGRMQGRLVRNVPVTIGPLSVSGTTVGVGLVGGADRALLGQSFLSKFEVRIGREEMVIGAGDNHRR
jgi:aspartyl protease family protein